VNPAEIDKQFEKWRNAGHGAVVHFDADGSGQRIAGIIFEPGPQRPTGYEDGIFVSVPTDADRIYYLDPEASREQGRLIMQVIDMKPEAPAGEITPEALLKDFDYIRQAPEVKRGGGAISERNSKDCGIIDIS